MDLMDLMDSVKMQMDLMDFHFLSDHNVPCMSSNCSAENDEATLKWWIYMASIPDGPARFQFLRLWNVSYCNANVYGEPTTSTETVKSFMKPFITQNNRKLNTFEIGFCTPSSQKRGGEDKRAAGTIRVDEF